MRSPRSPASSFVRATVASTAAARSSGGLSALARATTEPRAHAPPRPAPDAGRLSRPHAPGRWEGRDFTLVGTTNKERRGGKKGATQSGREEIRKDAPLAVG